ncbi:hypothetical protein ACLOJK_028729, partial [Asimina triloba]
MLEDPLALEEITIDETKVRTDKRYDEDLSVKEKQSFQIADDRDWFVKVLHNRPCLEDKLGARRHVDSDGGDSAMEIKLPSVNVMNYLEARFASVNKKLLVMDRRLQKIDEWVNG